jgi:hypothetical protein
MPIVWESAWLTTRQASSSMDRASISASAFDWLLGYGRGNDKDFPFLQIVSPDTISLKLCRRYCDALRHADRNPTEARHREVRRIIDPQPPQDDIRKPRSAPSSTGQRGRRPFHMPKPSGLPDRSSMKLRT